MSHDVSFNTCPVSGIRIEKNFNKINFSARMGSYFHMDHTQISNQKHFHDCYEMVLVLDGKGTFLYENKSYKLTCGDVFLSDPGIEHEIHVDINQKLTLIYFFFNIRQKPNNRCLTYEERLLDKFLISHRNVLQNQSHLMSYIYFFENYINNRKPKDSYWFINTLENFIFECIELMTSQRLTKEITESVEGTLFEKALDYIDQNLEKKITAADIASKVCTSKRNLYNLFRNNIDRTVHDYIYYRKILLAEYYLNMNLSVTEASKLVGIDSLSRFNKLFKKYKNISPSQCKKRDSSFNEGYGRRLVKS